jgi:hypothetical protein
MLIGESFVGAGAEAAHVNTVLGDRDGPVGVADAVREGIVDPAGASTLLLIAAVWVNGQRRRPGLCEQPGRDQGGAARRARWHAQHRRRARRAVPADQAVLHGPTGRPHHPPRAGQPARGLGPA